MARRYSRLSDVKIREMANIRGMSLHEIARQLDVPWGTFHQWVLMKVGVKPERIEQLAKLLGCEAQDIILKEDWDLKMEALRILDSAQLRRLHGEGTMQDVISAWRAAAAYHLVKPKDELIADAAVEGMEEAKEILKTLLGAEDEDDEASGG